MHRLEQQGWIRAKWGDSENNRRAKFYSLTPDGAKYLRQEQAQWKRLSLAIDLVLETP
jgi:PadR family transcriptional regulator PadR